MASYSDKLKDPRWQKKRLEILSRDEFTCQYCWDKETTLHVHHYQYSGNPWDAHPDSLVTVCEVCHSILEYDKKRFKDCSFDISRNDIGAETDILFRVVVYSKINCSLVGFIVFKYLHSKKELICLLDLNASEYQWLMNSIR